MENSSQVKTYDKIKLQSNSTKYLLYHGESKNYNEKNEWFGIDAPLIKEKKSLYHIKNNDVLVFTNLGLNRNLHSEDIKDNIQSVTFCKPTQNLHKQDLWQIQLIKNDEQFLLTNLVFRLMHFNTKKYLFSRKVKSQFEVGCSDLIPEDPAFLWVIKDFEAYIVTSTETPNEEDSVKQKKRKKSQPKEMPADRAGSLSQYEEFFRNSQQAKQQDQSEGQKKKSSFFFCCQEDREELE